MKTYYTDLIGIPNEQTMLSWIVTNIEYNETNHWGEYANFGEVVFQYNFEIYKVLYPQFACYSIQNYLNNKQYGFNRCIEYCIITDFIKTMFNDDNIDSFSNRNDNEYYYRKGRDNCIEIPEYLDCRRFRYIKLDKIIDVDFERYFNESELVHGRNNPFVEYIFKLFFPEYCYYTGKQIRWFHYKNVRDFTERELKNRKKKIVNMLCNNKYELFEQLNKKLIKQKRA